MKNYADLDTGLFGLIHSNRSKEDHWSKNCFNSSFPASLCCYMLEHHHQAIYIKLDGKNSQDLETIVSTISIRDLFKMSDDMTLDDLYFDFEAVYKPFEQFSEGDIDVVDLVIRNYPQKEYLKPLEVKLTVMPDSTTWQKPEDEWGCELVVRPATTEYIALSMYEATQNYKDIIFEIFDKVCSKISDWTNQSLVANYVDDLLECVKTYNSLFLDHQTPLILQTIWKTKGKTPILEDRAFDVVVWSNFAFTALFMGKTMWDSKNTGKVLSRAGRAVVRLSRCLWELSKTGKVDTKKIYRQMAYDKQTDKEFSTSGIFWRSYVKTSRLVTFAIHKDALFEIIQRGYLSRLQPERRFDQTLYFTVAEKEL